MATEDAVRKVYALLPSAEPSLPGRLRAQQARDWLDGDRREIRPLALAARRGNR
ncbi:hypothetical protein [Amycolatopsis sp. NPDC054798]